MTNLNTLRKRLSGLGVDYFILPNSDEFFNEYLPENSQRIKFLTGFSGSNAILVVGQTKLAFFTDGRYTTQAKNQLNIKSLAIFNLSEKTPWQWLTENLKPEQKVGFDPKLHKFKQIRFYQEKSVIDLIALEQNPVDTIWTQSKFQGSKVFLHPVKYSGLSSKIKINQLIESFKKDSQVLILNAPATICWLLNLRAQDIAYTPLALCQAIIYQDYQIDLFINPKRIDQKVKKYLELIGVRVIAPEFFAKSLSKLKKATITIDPETTNYWLYQQIEKYAGKIIEKTDPCLLLKACKNPTEIAGAIKAHKIDGLALTKFLFWLEKNLNAKKPIDEITAAQKLLELRQQNKDFLFPSFATISGFGANGAIIHYQATSKTNQKLQGNSLYLIDSGGQYYFGTTDVTRTVLVGKISKAIKENFTNVLKGHLELTMAKFSVGTSGANLDALARYYLWQNGKDYDHGTGHGVGSFSSVHEGPQSISKRSNSCALQPGMIISNEPGYYQVGEYGIRIENLVLVEECQNPNYQGFLQFKNLTLAPIDQRLIDFTMLNPAQKKWLKDYHLEIEQKLSDKLNLDEKRWLRKIVEFYSQSYLKDLNKTIKGRAK